MTARTDSTATKVTNYFMKNPTAVPGDVAAKFGAGGGNVYTYRKRALAALAGKETKVFFPKKTLDEALALPVAPNGQPPEANGNGQAYSGFPSQQEKTITDSWTNHGTFLSRDEYRGYLRGRVVDLMRDGLRENFAEAMRCADKLTQLARAEGN